MTLIIAFHQAISLQYTVRLIIKSARERIIHKQVQAYPGVQREGGCPLLEGGQEGGR